MSWNMWRLIVIITGLLGLALMAPESITAATLTVTDLGDSGAAGQLRTLINAAASGDTIVIPAGTITLTGAAGELFNTGGDLNIRKNLTIQGQGPGVTILDGGGIDRVLRIDGAATATISGVTVRNGNAGAGTGGGIRSSGTLTVVNSTISGNTTNSDAGGIDADGGSLTLTNVTVAGNTATRDGGGIHAAASASLTNVTVSGNTATRDGGGIVSNGTFTLTSSTVSANAGQLGGGILNNGTLTLVNSTISGNTATDEGGGIRNEGTLILGNSTISGNTGVLGGGVDNVGSMTLTNVTVSGNTVSNEGAGLFNSSSGSATLTNVTLAANSGLFSGGVRNEAGGAVTLKNTIIERGQSGANCSGPITSQGHNLSSDDSCLASLTAPGDVNASSALLAALQNNGGPTQTHALLEGSPAIDAGTNTGCPPTDQRGVPRPQGAACDMGAYEFGPPVAAVALNGSAFHMGQTVTYQATLIPGFAPTQVDIYLGALLPDGVTFASLVEVSPGAISFALGPAPIPFSANVTLTQAVIPFSYTFSGFEPGGPYFMYAGLVNAGTSNLISLAVQACQFNP